MPTDLQLPTVEDVRAAAVRIAGHVHETPVLTSSTFDRQLGAQLFFKAENFQKVGAFKARGATNAALSLADDEAARGLITHSSGNHAAAVAYAAAKRGVSATVVMPHAAPAIKVEAVRGYGAEIVFCQQSQRDEVCAAEQHKRGATFIHPFNDPRVIAGQGTATLELLRQVPDLDLVIAPVGGGGLISGATLTASAAGVEVWGAEPEAVDDAYRSLQTGVRQPAVKDPDTVCDGLLTGLGELTYAILAQHGISIQTVSDDETLIALRDVLQRMKIVIEPSCATVLAALRRRKEALAGRRVGVILSGGNTDFSWLAAAEAATRRAAAHAAD